MLDIRKAFDTADRDATWNRLRRRGTPNCIIALVRSLYDDCTTTMFVNGVRGESVQLERGIFQGGILSPDLYNVFIDDIVPMIDAAAGVDCPILGDRRLPLIMFADDMTLFSTRATGAQRMLDAAAEYARDNFFEFNADKSLTVTAPHIAPAAGQFDVDAFV